METILIVDDIENNRSTLIRKLEKEGYNLLSAENGIEALKVIEQNQVDLVLLDYMMPEMNGYDTLVKIKENEKWNHIQVVMLSAANDIEKIVECIEKGADDYLTKPISSILLKARLKTCLKTAKIIKNATFDESQNPIHLENQNPGIKTNNTDQKKHDMLKSYLSDLAKEVSKAQLKIMPFLHQINILLAEKFQDQNNETENDKTKKEKINDLISKIESEYYSIQISLKILEHSLLPFQCEILDLSNICDEIIQDYGPLVKKNYETIPQVQSYKNILFIVIWFVLVYNIKIVRSSVTKGEEKQKEIPFQATANEHEIKLQIGSPIESEENMNEITQLDNKVQKTIQKMAEEIGMKMGERFDGNTKVAFEIRIPK